MNRNILSSESKVYANKGNQAVLAMITGLSCKILDVGCGSGDNAAVLVAQGHQVDGITLSEKEAMLCRKVMRKVYIHNLEEGLPSAIQDQYDYIICSHVIEHITYPQGLLRDIRIRLTPKGRLIMALPNIMHYQSRLKLVFGQFDYEDTGIWDYTHVRWYTFQSGFKLLEENGFKVISKQVDGDIPLLSLFRFVPYNIRQVFYRMLTRISKGLFGGQLIYMALQDCNLGEPK